MNDPDDAPKAIPPRKRKSTAKRIKSESGTASTNESFAQEARTALEQIRASTLPAYAFKNPLESLDPLHSIRAVTEMSRGMSLAADELSDKHLRDLMKGIDPVSEAKSLGLMAQNTSDILRSLSHNPAKDALEQMKATSQIFRDTTASMRAIADSPVSDILKNMAPLYEAKTVSSLAANAAATLNSLYTNPLKDMANSLDSFRQASTISQSVLGTSIGAGQTALDASTAWKTVASNPLKDILKTLNPLHQMKTVSQMASEASAAMFAAASPLRSVVKEFSVVSEMVRGVKELQNSLAYRPISQTINALDQLKQIQKSISISEVSLADRVPAFGHVDFTTYLEHSRPAFASGFTAQAAHEAAIGMAATISEQVVSTESEKLFSREEIAGVIAAVREVLLSEDEQQRNEAAKHFSEKPAFAFMLGLIINILAYFIIIYSQQTAKELEIHNRSLPAIEYAMNSNDKPHIGIIRRTGGAYVYEKPDKRSVLAHKYIEGEFIALMWDRKKGWRKVAYEIDLGRMKALKVGWIQDSDYDRTNMPVKSLFLRLYVEQ